MLPYAKKILEMKRQGMAQHIKNLVLIGVDSVSEELQSQADSYSINLYRFEALTERSEESKSECPRVTPEPDFTFIISYTSGTTGRPKGAVHTAGSLSAMVQMLHAGWNYNCDDVILHCLPLHHVHGLVNKLIAFHAVGATVKMEVSL